MISFGIGLLSIRFEGFKKKKRKKKEEKKKEKISASRRRMMAPRAPFIGNLREAAATVSLAMQKIALLDAGNHGSTRAGDQRRGALKKATDCNQRSRWVEAKENACSDVVRIVVDACCDLRLVAMSACVRKRMSTTCATYANEGRSKL